MNTKNMTMRNGPETEMNEGTEMKVNEGETGYQGYGIDEEIDTSDYQFEGGNKDAMKKNYSSRKA